MRLLASTDIALRVLMLLGRRKSGQNINVEQIAHQLGGLSRNHLHKIVQDLAALGILCTVRGGGGGVSLAKPLSDVRLGALVRALETDQAIVECFREGGGGCVLDSGCRLRAMLRKARECFYKSLDKHTLADCAAGPWFASIDKLTPKASKRSANA